MLELFVQTTPGLEPALAEELAEVGLVGTPEPGGITLVGNWPLVARLGLHLSCASRVLVTVGAFRSTALGELERKASRLDWARFLPPGATPAFRVTCRKSRLYHTGAVAERLGRAVAGSTSAAVRPMPDDRRAAEEPLPFVVRIVRDRVTIRADGAGEHLHRRGYRLATAGAPLRETLAAGLLRLTGWTPDRALVDPLCGSGTFVIEAGLRACRIPPGGARGFACLRWPIADHEVWSALQADAAAARHPAPAPLSGSDRDAGAVASARDNAARAGLSGEVVFERRSVSAAAAPETGMPGLLMTNPPWGLRMGDTAALRDLHARIGQVARREFAGWSLALVSPSERLVCEVDRRAQRTAMIRSGGVAVGLWTVAEL